MSSIESINTNSQKVDEKKMTVSTNLTFCGLPCEDAGFVIEASEANKLKTCKKLNVTYTRVYIDAVYGSKKKELKRDPDAVKNVEKFLHEFFEHSGSEDIEKTENFDDWRNRYALTKVQLVLNQRARIEALRLENADISKTIASLQTMESADKVDENALAELEAMVARLRAKKDAA
jgi:hypothetical protein